MIETRDLLVNYGNRTAFGPLCAVMGQKTLLITGPAQCGKTTLLKTLCGLIKPTAGTVLVDGQDLWQERRAREKAQSRFGMVFQSDALFDSMDAITNVAFPLLRRHVCLPEAEQRAGEALAQVGLAGQERVLPECLSGGMRKRLGLARAIVARPQYLLADDPLAGLDPDTGERVRALLFELWHGRGGLIVATANPEPFARHCDQVIQLAP